MAKRDRTSEAGSKDGEMTTQTVTGADMVRTSEQSTLAKQISVLNGVDPSSDQNAKKLETAALAVEVGRLNIEGETGFSVNAYTGEMGALPPEASEDGLAAGVVEESEVTLLKKLVAKDIVGRRELKCTKKWVPQLDAAGKAMSAADGSPLGEWDVSPQRDLYIIYGTASGTNTGTTGFGEWNSFTGYFEANRLSDGARFASNEAILQEPGNTLLLRELVAIKQKARDATIVFSFIVGVRTSMKWVQSGEGTTYEYTLKSILKIQKHDPLAGMRKALAKYLPQKALPAPTSQPTNGVETPAEIPPIVG